MNISGSFAKNAFVSKWLSSDDPTRLFQLLLGDGQHTFAAHGKSCLIAVIQALGIF
jgi:hypothetical protein